MWRTKIVCTLGPAVDSREAVRARIRAGMNVARLNCSHGNWEERRRRIEWVRELSPKLAPVAVLVDLQGPKFRIGEVASGAIELRPGQEVVVGPGPGADIPVLQPEVACQLDGKCRLLLGDGGVEVRLVKASGGDESAGNFVAKVISGGTLRSRQGVTIPGRSYSGPVITDKDRADIAEALKLGVDYVALSYVRGAEDLRELRSVLGYWGVGVLRSTPASGAASPNTSMPQDPIPLPKLCAKIETKDALRNLEEVVAEADLVMVARGDLGLQMEFEEVPIAQKRIIEHCTRVGKPVITATQMLESMINAPRPTRAEATDVTNAILDGTDAVMLSAETAAGKFPVEAVKAMAKIANEADKHLDRERIERDFDERAKRGVKQTEAVAHAVAQLAALIKPAAILTTTTSGQTARLVSKFRPRTKILCATWSERSQAQMAAVWGVEALCLPLPSSTDEVVDLSIDAFLEAGKLHKGDTVIVTAGVPAGTPGNTNLILVRVV